MPLRVDSLDVSNFLDKLYSNQTEERIQLLMSNMSNMSTFPIHTTRDGNLYLRDDMSKKFEYWKIRYWIHSECSHAETNSQ